MSGRFASSVGGTRNRSELASDFRLTHEELIFFHTYGYLGPFSVMDERFVGSYSRLILDKKVHFPVLTFHLLRCDRLKNDLIETFLIPLQQVRNKIVRKGGPLGLPRYWYKSTHLLIPEVARVGLMPEIIHRLQIA
jgi:hypothetical protein